jgi:gamma-glutamyl phosphate reductase
MTIVAVQEPPGTVRRAPAIQAKPGSPTEDAAGRARRLHSAIDHHRTEARRLAAAAKQHRAALVSLISERDQDVAQLRRAGLQLASIGRLYSLTPQRVQQIVKSAGGV